MSGRMIVIVRAYKRVGEQEGVMQSYRWRFEKLREISPGYEVHDSSNSLILRNSSKGWTGFMMSSVPSSRGSRLCIMAMV